MKISIIIPTYNDEKYILDTLESINEQSYNNYEIIIVNDGSTDNTEEILKKYIKKNSSIKYIYQKNQDQLKAVLNGANYVTGDIVFILHSDDILNNKYVLEKARDYFVSNIGVDAIISNLVLIDENKKYIGMQKVKKFKKTNSSLLQTFLYLGRNMYCDTAFFKKDVFMNSVKDNYLTWNMPFWFDSKGKVLNVKNVDFPFVSYRQSDSNYILSDLGKLNVMNGELRVVNTLSDLFTIPAYKLQFNLYRVFKKLGINYSVFNKPGKMDKKYDVFNYVINKRYSSSEIENNVYLNSLLKFYNSDNKRTIKFNFKKVYYGNEIREFNKKLLSSKLEKEYYDFFNEMHNGFSIVETNNVSNMKTVLKFLNISGVEVVEVKK